jgi:Ala-tRNA(Pro) deacylase
MQIAELLRENDVDFETVVYPPAFTAQKRAMRLGISGRHVLKSVLLAGPEGFLLAVLPATERVDAEALARALGGPVRLAAPEEIARVFPDCEWGVVQPLGSAYGIRTLLDDSVSPDDCIVLGMHSHAHAVRMSCRDFERIEQPERVRFGMAK